MDATDMTWYHNCSDEKGTRSFALDNLWFPLIAIHQNSMCMVLLNITKQPKSTYPKHFVLCHLVPKSVCGYLVSTLRNIQTIICKHLTFEESETCTVIVNYQQWVK